MIEQRHITTELRAVRLPDDTVNIGGIAVPFDQWQDIGGVFHERIDASAFRDTLSDDDQVLLMSHGGEPIARRSTGTLSLVPGKDGLELSAQIDTRDPDSQKAAVKIERGDFGGLSIGFVALREQWDEQKSKVPSRTILSAELREVSLVAFPAYGDTTIGLRSLEASRRDRKAYNSPHYETELRRAWLSHQKLRHRF